MSRLTDEEAMIELRRMVADAGYMAGIEGKAVWENPWTRGNDNPGDMLCWHAYWCQGAQQRDRQRLLRRKKKAEKTCAPQE